MIRPILPLLLLMTTVSAGAQDRVVGLASFDRLRIEGPFDVTVTTGRSPGARIVGDRRAADRVEVRADGTTLIVRRSPNAWGETPGVAGASLHILLSTPMLAMASATGGARVSIDSMRGDRASLTLSGGGVMRIDTVAVGDVTAQILGPGDLTLAGRANRLSLSVAGPGHVDAAALDAGTVSVRQEGTGEILAHARQSAQVTTFAGGTVTISGPARCLVRGATGSVTCAGGLQGAAQAGQGGFRPG